MLYIQILYIYINIIYVYVNTYTYTYQYTAQGGGGNFMIRNYGRGELLYVQQSKSTDGPKSGWSCLFGWVAMVTSPTTAGYSCSAVQCSVV